MTANHRELAETHLAMLNSHDSDAVDRFVAVDYINHNPLVADGQFAEHWDELNLLEFFGMIGP